MRSQLRTTRPARALAALALAGVVLAGACSSSSGPDQEAFCAASKKADKMNLGDGTNVSDFKKNFADLNDVISGAKSDAPDAISDDFDKLAAAFSSLNEKVQNAKTVEDISKISQEAGGMTDVQKASDNVDAWTKKNCK